MQPGNKVKVWTIRINEVFPSDKSVRDFLAEMKGPVAIGKPEIIGEAAWAEMHACNPETEEKVSVYMQERFPLIRSNYRDLEGLTAQTIATQH